MRRKGVKVQSEDQRYKIMRNKEQTKTLMLHIIGLVLHLAPTHSEKLSYLTRILKREEKELKSYCQELGVKLESCTSKDRDTGKEFEELRAILK